jgi:hypothetical protein
MSSKYPSERICMEYSSYLQASIFSQHPAGGKCHSGDTDHGEPNEGQNNNILASTHFIPFNTPGVEP